MQMGQFLSAILVVLMSFNTVHHKMLFIEALSSHYFDISRNLSKSPEAINNHFFTLEKTSNNMERKFEHLKKLFFKPVYCPTSPIPKCFVMRLFLEHQKTSYEIVHEVPKRFARDSAWSTKRRRNEIVPGVPRGFV